MASQFWSLSPTSLRSACALALLLGLAPAAPAAASSLSLLTYNVAGLPEGISSSNPTVNTPLISPLLNGFDLALVQEDFAFHPDLISQAAHPHQTDPDPDDVFNADGLNRFSNSAFSDHTRITWDDCFGLFNSGSDCLTTKGFSFARHEVLPGAFVDVYNWHADAGGDPGSTEARQSNLRQLGAFIQAQSAGNAVIVGGDSNSRYTDPEDIVPELLAATDLLDVWVELVRGGVRPDLGADFKTPCETDPESADCELIDKIFYRSSALLELTPSEFHVPDAQFRRADGEPLSDHRPVFAVFELSALPEPSGALLFGLAAVCAARRSRRGAGARG